MPERPRVQGRRTGTWAVGIVAALALSSALLACGGDDDDPVLLELPAAYIVGANPPLGSEVFCGTPVNVVFNRDPGPVRSLHADLDPARQTGARRRFRVVIEYGPLELRWGEAEAVKAYSVFCEPGEPPTLVDTTPDWFDAPAVVLDTDGFILHFDQPVTLAAVGSPGAFTVRESDGDAWPPTVSAVGADVTVRAPPGRAFVRGETYRLEGTVADLGGNQTVISIEITVVAGGA